MFLKSIFFTLIVFIPVFAFAKESRLVASITEVESKVEARNRITILEGNIETVNAIRKNFMQKYIDEYSKKEGALSQAEVDNFKKNLDIVLNSKKVMKPKNKQRNPASWSSPKELEQSFSKTEKRQMDGYFTYFNQQVYPLLEQGIKNKDKSKIIQGLKRWDSNAQKYNKFIQANIDKLKPKAG